MAGPYNPPNPYGAYFSFGQPEAAGVAAAAQVGPIPGQLLSPAAMASVGAGSGGFNPTPMEYLNNQIRQQYQQRFLAETMRNDPRVQSITTMLLNQMSAQAQRSTLNLFNGRTNFQEMVGTVMSMPGIASLIGGGTYSLGQGALAATTGGMRVGGVGLFNNDAAGIAGASQLVQAMTRQFYMAGGASNVAMTSGLNRDQIGGIMMAGAAQGAFAGLNLGSFVEKGKALSFKMDEATMSKVTQFTKTAAKALSSLIDVYGSQSMAELANKAQQITGLDLSRLGNPQLMINRLGALRQTGMAMGVDTQTMFDLSAYAIQTGKNLGLSSGFASNAGISIASQAATIFRTNQMQAGSFSTATPSLQEITVSLMRDQAGMSRDPVGRRQAALQLGLETGHFSGKAADEARRLMREDGPGAIGRIDSFMRSQGLNTEAYIRLMGGPEGLMDNLSDAGKSSVREGYSRTVMERARRLFDRQARQALGADATSAGGKALMTTIQGVGMDTLDMIFKGARGGFNRDDARKLLLQDPEGRARPEFYLDQIQTAVSDLGGDRAAAMHATLQQGIKSHPYMGAHFMTESAKRTEALNRMGVMSFTENERGAMQLGYTEGLLRIMGGSDPRSSFVRAVNMFPGQVTSSFALPKAGQKMSFGEAQVYVNDMIQAFSSQKGGADVLKAFGITGALKEGDTATAKRIMDAMSNEVVQQTAFSGFQLANFGGRITGMSKERMSYAQQYGDVQAIAKSLGESFGDISLQRNAEILALQPENADKATKLIYRASANLDIISKLDSTRLKTIAEQSPMWATGTMEFLRDNAAAALASGNEKLAKEYDVQLKRLSDATGKATATEISGTLDLVGDALQIKGWMNSKKK